MAPGRDDVRGARGFRAGTDRPPACLPFSDVQSVHLSQSSTTSVQEENIVVGVRGRKCHEQVRLTNAAAPERAPG